MTIKSVVLIFLLTLISCAQPSKEITNITVSDLKSELENNIQLLDVRTPKEWQNGIIDNAMLINVKNDKFETIALQKLDKSQPVYVYCKSGGRSLVASEILVINGFKVYNVLGGYDEWQEENRD